MYVSRTQRFHSLYNLGMHKVHVVPRLHMLCTYMYTLYKCITQAYIIGSDPGRELEPRGTV